MIEKKRHPLNKRMLLTPLFLILVMAIALSVGCVPQEEVRVEAFSYLEQMSREGINTIDTEIAKIDQQLRDTEEKLLKLDQVAASALKWVEDKKATIDITMVPCG